MQKKKNTFRLNNKTICFNYQIKNIQSAAFFSILLFKNNYISSNKVLKPPDES